MHTTHAISEKIKQARKSTHLTFLNLQMSTDGTDDAASIAMAENNNWRGSGATRATS